MSGIEDLLELMARLRDPQHGCPWDREQSFASIAPYTIEEAHEVADAIERGDLDALRDELGDLLFQVVFHAQMARECGAFDFGDVVRAIVHKMHRRHPHVFGGERIASAQAQTEAWEAHKEAERGGSPESLMDSVTRSLPALHRARKLQQRAARVGFDWPHVGAVIEKLREEGEELERALAQGQEAVAAELGDLLFTVVNLARHLGVDPDSALRGASGRFERRFRHIEVELATRGRRVQDCGAEELDVLWEEAKARGL